MGFSSVWNKAWKDYHDNFKATAPIMFFYYLLPLFILGAFFLVLFWASGLFSDLAYFSSQGEGYDIQSEEALSFLGKFFVLAILAIIAFTVLAFISFLGYATIVYGAAKGKAFRMREIIKEGKKIYWRFLGVSTLIVLIFFGVEIVMLLAFAFSLFFGALFSKVSVAIGAVVGTLLAIGLLVGLGLTGGLIFSRYLLAPYALADRGLRVFESMKESWRMTKGKSWKILGYFLFSMIFTSAIYYAFFALALIASLPFVSVQEALFAQTLNNGFIIFQIISNVILQPVFAFFVIPWSVFFFGNLYREIGGERKKRA